MANFTSEPTEIEGTLTDFAELSGRKAVAVMIVFTTLQGLPLPGGPCQSDRLRQETHLSKAAAGVSVKYGRCVG